MLGQLNRTERSIEQLDQKQETIGDLGGRSYRHSL